MSALSTMELLQVSNKIKLFEPFVMPVFKNLLMFIKGLYFLPWPLCLHLSPIYLLFLGFSHFFLVFYQWICKLQVTYSIIIALTIKNMLMSAIGVQCSLNLYIILPIGHNHLYAPEGYCQVFKPRLIIFLPILVPSCLGD